MLLAHVAQHLAVLDERRGADRAFFGEVGKPDDGRDAVAAGGDLHQRVLAQLEESRFPEQVERRSAAEGLLGEEHQVGLQALRFVDGVDDFELVALDITDRVV